MAWRIDEHVIRGEIDNRIRDRVTGRIWFAGRDEPVILDLTGNAWRDIAGRRLEFVTPDPKPGLAPSFAAHQRGTAGDITASRKVRVPDIPLNQIGEYYLAKKPFPWHWGNSLYLEWYGVNHGRIVIESAAFQLTVSPESTWEMTLEDEDTQRKANAAGLSTFMEIATDALATEQEATSHRPQTEAEAEKLQANSDRIADRVAARMESEGPDADYTKILLEEIERARRERGGADPTPEQEAQGEQWIEDMNAAADETLEDDKADEWKQSGETSTGGRTERFYKHPLSVRSLLFSLRVKREIGERGWINHDENHEHPIAVLTIGLTGGAAKLAGALNGNDWPLDADLCAPAIVRLKKAASYLEDAKLAAESCRDEALVDATWLAEVEREVDAIAAETNDLITELRMRLESGT